MTAWWTPASPPVSLLTPDEFIACLSAPLAEQPYLGPGGNRTLWTADVNTPGAVYFVRVTMLNSTAPNATVASNAVAYGQVRRGRGVRLMWGG